MAKTSPSSARAEAPSPKCPRGSLSAEQEAQPGNHSQEWAQGRAWAGGHQQGWRAADPPSVGWQGGTEGTGEAQRALGWQGGQDELSRSFPGAPGFTPGSAPLPG